MDPQIRSIQPGGGVCMRLELAWGHVRRWYLKRFRRTYLRHMADCRRDPPVPVSHEVLDSRDTKFYRNQPVPWWLPEDDPFAWRDRLPFARAGLAELVLLGGAGLMLAMLLTWLFPWAVPLPLLAAACIAWFFRNPRRRAPDGPDMIVAPADGRVVLIEHGDGDEYLEGPAVTIGIFLSIFNVHINRAPEDSIVIGVTYRRGKFLNALRPESARENEQLEVRLETCGAPHRGMRVRQIAGAIARRIVCWVKPGDRLHRGEQFGMIKLGSRTELVLPCEPELEILVRVGDRVRAGSTVLARYGRARVASDQRVGSPSAPAL